MAATWCNCRLPHAMLRRKRPQSETRLLSGRGALSKVLLTPALLALLVFSPARAQNDESELASIRDQITNLSQTLNADAAALRETRERSFELKKQVDPFRSKQSELEARLTAKQSQVKSLGKELSKFQNQLNTLLDGIRGAAIQQYVIASQPTLKMLLNQSDPAAVNRNLAYLGYLTRTHESEMNDIQQKIQTLEATRAALKTEKQALQALKHDNDLALSELQHTLQDLDGLEKSIALRMSEDNARLDVLKEDELRLRNLIEQLGHPQKPSSPIADFGSLKGKLLWPAEGRVTKAPGRAMRDGGATWSGVIINSKPGTEVKAIARGRVVFSDWFRNLGKLVIVDHGNGFLTLYGNNDQVFMSAGDLVDSGDTIATVGDASSDMPAGLYFEIRESGKPLDPRQWFARR